MIVVTLIILGSLAAGALVFRNGVVVVRVDGGSMTPTYRHGERVLAIRRWALPRVRRGDIVVLWSPDPSALRPGAPQYIIKRVAALAGDLRPGGRADETISPQHIFVLGDADSSRDSRSFGPLPRHMLVGRVVWRMPGNGRAQPAAGE